MRILLLGGTSEARALAARLHPDVDVISSLAGRVPDPALPVGEVRIGGFGGVDGLRRWLADSAVDAVVDATHPYAATITAHAAAVCARAGVAASGAGPARLATGRCHRGRLRHARPRRPLQSNGFSRVFLTTGRSGIAAFADVDAWFLIRAVTAPDPHGLPRHHDCCCRAGRTATTTSSALLREHRIDALVTKNSGGAMTRPKLDAAAALGVAVVMVDRPPLPAGVHTVPTVDDAVAWVRSTGRS